MRNYYLVIFIAVISFILGLYSGREDLNTPLPIVLEPQEDVYSNSDSAKQKTERILPVKSSTQEPDVSKNTKPLTQSNEPLACVDRLNKIERSFKQSVDSKILSMSKKLAQGYAQTLKLPPSMQEKLEQHFLNDFSSVPLPLDDFDCSTEVGIIVDAESIRNFLGEELYKQAEWQREARSEMAKVREFERDLYYLSRKLSLTSAQEDVLSTLLVQVGGRNNLTQAVLAPIFSPDQLRLYEKLYE